MIWTTGVINSSFIPMPKMSADRDDDSPHPSYLLKFRKSTIKLWEAALPTLKEDSRQCVSNQ